MRLLVAGLIYIAVSAIAALLMGMCAGGITYAISLISLLAGTTAAIAAFFACPPPPGREAADRAPESLFSYALLWLLGFVFALFAVRSFCWLAYLDGEYIRIQSPNNLGDLGLHITYIKTFANGVSLWPDSPLYVYSKLRYPAGMDLFNALLASLGFDLCRQLAATGIVASIATFYAFYRWSGAFGIAGFLFNGGIAGYEFLALLQFADYQGGPHISWKSIALSMFVTQRGLLYAIPAGLILLWQWRARYGSDLPLQKERLPAWIEFILYASMPLFHVHTFLALSVVLICVFVTQPHARRSLIQLTAAAFIPATFFVYLITDNFHANSVFQWHLGWTQNVGEFAMPFPVFWLVNFGLSLPLAVALVILMGRTEWLQYRSRRSRISLESAYLAAAVLIFLIVCTVKTAPWEWDNTKILIWAYFITLPLLWTHLVKRWSVVPRAATCVLLFFSGFVSLIGGLAAGRPGFEFADRASSDFVAEAVRPLPVEARFAAFPTYNHPLLINGRKVVMGYEGHLWTQGIDYHSVAVKLRSLMLGQGDWIQTARDLHVRYLFWGPQEAQNYATSTRPWEAKLRLVAKGNWGSIYDFGR